jgi:hypothetical protein
MAGIVRRIMDGGGMGEGHANEQRQSQQGREACLHDLRRPRLYCGCLIGNSCLCHAFVLSKTNSCQATRN